MPFYSRVIRSKLCMKVVDHWYVAYSIWAVVAEKLHSKIMDHVLSIAVLFFYLCSCQCNTKGRCKGRI